MSKADTLFVQDTTCTPRELERTHSILLGDGREQPYTFKFQEELEMPREHALKFLIDGAWIVTDHDGNRITAPKKSDETKSLPVVGLDECVAKHEELTQNALLLRAAPIPGAEDFHKSTKKEIIIAFLVAYNKRQAGISETPEDADTEDMSQAELDEMFADEAA